MIKRQHADSSNRRLVKELEKAKKRLEAKLQTLAAEHKKDNTLTFEELGVDRLFVDEAHYFKDLFYVTKMTRVAGLPQTASERAFDMFLKVRHVQSLNGGGGVVFATGTPITDTALGTIRSLETALLGWSMFVFSNGVERVLPGPF